VAFPWWWYAIQKGWWIRPSPLRRSLRAKPAMNAAHHAMITPNHAGWAEAIVCAQMIRKTDRSISIRKKFCSGAPREWRRLNFQIPPPRPLDPSELGCSQRKAARQLGLRWGCRSSLASDGLIPELIYSDQLVSICTWKPGQRRGQQPSVHRMTGGWPLGPPVRREPNWLL
jgi:hypothetical protein